MKNIKRLLLFITVVSLLVLAFSGCRKEKITKWRCVPYEGCLIEISVDHERDLVYVAADYHGFVPPNPSIQYHFLFYDNTILKKTGDHTLQLLDQITHEPDLLTFLIASQSDETMDIIAINFLNDCDAYSYYVTDYHFIRVS